MPSGSSGQSSSGITMVGKSGSAGAAAGTGSASPVRRPIRVSISWIRSRMFRASPSKMASETAGGTVSFRSIGGISRFSGDRIRASGGRCPVSTV